MAELSASPQQLTPEAKMSALTAMKATAPTTPAIRALMTVLVIG